MTFKIVDYELFQIQRNEIRQLWQGDDLKHYLRLNKVFVTIDIVLTFLINYSLDGSKSTGGSASSVSMLMLVVCQVVMFLFVRRKREYLRAMGFMLRVFGAVLFSFIIFNVMSILLSLFTLLNHAIALNVYYVIGSMMFDLCIEWI
jgi:hypothetical protein